jgi:SAM-dependent methyltransferase
VTWRDFWNGETTIYVSERHREIHYRRIAQDIVSILPDDDCRILDFGCGEALSAGLVAASCRSLVLCDAAETVRNKIRSRTRGISNTRVVSPEAVEAMPDGSFDLIVANSVIQYLSRSELEGWLRTWRRVLSPAGRLVLGDIVPRRVGPLVDAAALLKFSAEHGFLMAAAGGLVRTALSDYRRKRSQLGLLQLDEAEIIAIALSQGLAAARSMQNLGHNPRRLTIVAQRMPHAAPEPMPVRERLPQAYNLMHSTA